MYIICLLYNNLSCNNNNNANNVARNKWITLTWKLHIDNSKSRLQEYTVVAVIPNKCKLYFFKNNS